MGVGVEACHSLPTSLVQYLDPQLTEEDEERRRRRRERNKVAATKCRNKKKEKTNFLMTVSCQLGLVASRGAGVWQGYSPSRHRAPIHSSNEDWFICFYFILYIYFIYLSTYLFSWRKSIMKIYI